MTFPDSLYRLLRPALFQLEAERAHRLAVRLLGAGPVGPGAAPQPALRQSLWSLDFPNPIGLAAGFDKNAECYRSALGLGFGFVEIGSVTPRPQAGNPRPRLFRLIEDRAVINRMGFNNDGMDAVAARLAGRDPKAGIVGVNLGKNKETADAAADYELGVARLGPLADYLVINVSSPNTPGLRALQGKEPLADLIFRTRAARNLLAVRPPLLLKIAPDLTDDDQRDIAAVAQDSGLDGLIISNTTIARPPLLATRHAGETGGLSGAPLFAPSTALLGRMYQLTEGKLPLIGVGGIATARDAYAKIRAGASLVQIYSAMVYEGPGLAARLAGDLPALLAADGFATISDAIGADHR
ncbi:MAG: quinone-dependent dihydroorotate dehydrogenase [Rhodospirillaceae bacterium]|nr:quinone-dependent dihydroorotate dehydrogenase [Rhodospirillaceae bacterium]